MNYEQMSDLEINKTVESLESPLAAGILTPDYCNSWSDMGPLIRENEITLIRDTSTNDVWLAISRAWFTVDGIESRDKIEFTHKNPLRAAAIVYLMSKGN